MPRELSSDAKNYAGPFYWLADITTPSGVPHFFWSGEREQVIAGKTYQPYLRITEPVRRTRSLRVDAGSIELLNADLAVAVLLAAEPNGFEGARCILSQFLLGIEDTVEIIRGRLTEQQEDEEAVRLRLVAELEPAQIDVHARTAAQLCTWPFARPTCGYDRATLSVTENLSEQTADIFSAATIGRTTLTMTTDEHKDRLAVLTAGTGRGQVRRIRSNTATTLALYQSWLTTPDATSKFKVVTAPAGMPKPLFSPQSGVESIAADIFNARTIGASALAMIPDEHRSEGPTAEAGLVRIVSGTGAGQQRRIKSNTATTITLADDEPDFSPAPDATSVFRVLHRFCPKDVAASCEQRARTQAFNGFPTLTPELARIFSTPTPARGGGTDGEGPPGRIVETL